MHLPGARPQPIATTFTAGVIVSGASLLRGWSFVETGGSLAAACDIYDGTGTNGNLVASINLKAGQSTRDWFADSGIEIRTGLYYKVTDGVMKGSLWVSPGEFADDFVYVKGPIPIP